MIRGIIYHWTAGAYNRTFNDYHYNITYDPAKDKAYVRKTCKNDSDVLAHTWRMNTGFIGISICCAAGAQFGGNLGKFPPTNKQIEAACHLGGVKMHEYNIPKNMIMTHATAADRILEFVPNDEPYGPLSGQCDKWDLWVPNWKGTGKNLSHLMIDKTLWYSKYAKWEKY